MLHVHAPGKDSGAPAPAASCCTSTVLSHRTSGCQKLLAKHEDWRLITLRARPDAIRFQDLKASWLLSQYVWRSGSALGPSSRHVHNGFQLIRDVCM